MNGLVNTVDAAIATGSANGGLFWSRPGFLDVMCKFSGLVAFPFDRLKCSIEMGGWGWSGGYQGITLKDGKGYDFSNQEVTSGSSYQEYDIAEVNAKLVLYTYPAYPSEPWPIVLYTITLNRALFYYWLLILGPNMLLAVISFGVFFVSVEEGERLSLGVTLILAGEVSKIVVSGFVPVCGELLWIDGFMLVCSSFMAFSLVESFAVLFLSTHSEEHLVPNWVYHLLHCRTEEEQTEKDENGIDPRFESVAGILFRRNCQSSQQQDVDTKKDCGSSSVGEDPSSTSQSGGMAARLIFFERLFFAVDSEARGFLRMREVARLLSFIVLSLSPEERNVLLERMDMGGDGLFSRLEFVQVCCEVLGDCQLDVIDTGVKNFFDAQSKAITRASSYWKSCARDLDRYCRFLLPTFYFAVIGWMLNVELTDNYEGTSTGMFQGPGPMSMSTMQILRTLTIPIILVLCMSAWFMMRRLAQKKNLTERMPPSWCERSRNQEKGPTDADYEEATAPTLEQQSG